MKRGEVKSDIAWATPAKVVIHGLDLCDEIVGKLDFGEQADHAVGVQPVFVDDAFQHGLGVGK